MEDPVNLENLLYDPITGIPLIISPSGVDDWNAPIIPPTATTAVPATITATATVVPVTMKVNKVKPITTTTSSAGRRRLNSHGEDLEEEQEHVIEGIDPSHPGAADPLTTAMGEVIPTLVPYAMRNVFATTKYIVPTWIIVPEELHMSLEWQMIHVLDYFTSTIHYEFVSIICLYIL